MTAEQQLERSVLEGKERDELHAIAQALSVKTTTRTKKADMIDGILKATGVSVDEGASPGSGGDGGAGSAAATTNGSSNGSSAGSSSPSRPDPADPDNHAPGSAPENPPRPARRPA